MCVGCVRGTWAGECVLESIQDENCHHSAFFHFFRDPFVRLLLNSCRRRCSCCSPQLHIHHAVKLLISVNRLYLFFFYYIVKDRMQYANTGRKHTRTTKIQRRATTAMSSIFYYYIFPLCGVRYRRYVVAKVLCAWCVVVGYWLRIVWRNE